MLLISLFMKINCKGSVTFMSGCKQVIYRHLAADICLQLRNYTMFQKLDLEVEGDTCALYTKMLANCKAVSIVLQY